MYDRPAAVELAFPRWHCCCWRANAHWRTVVWRGRRRRGEEGGGGRPLLSITYVYVVRTHFVRGTTLCPFSACIWSGIEQVRRAKQPRARDRDSSYEHTHSKAADSAAAEERLLSTTYILACSSHHHHHQALRLLCCCWTTTTRRTQ